MSMNNGNYTKMQYYIVKYSYMILTGLFCGHLVVIKTNITFQSAVLHYSCCFTSGSTNDSVLFYCIVYK